jgi:hypothetical protein
MSRRVTLPTAATVADVESAMIADLATACNALSDVPSTPDGTASPHRHALTRQLDEGSAPVPLRARGHVTGTGSPGRHPLTATGRQARLTCCWRCCPNVTHSHNAAPIGAGAFVPAPSGATAPSCGGPGPSRTTDPTAGAGTGHGQHQHVPDAVPDSGHWDVILPGRRY